MSRLHHAGWLTPERSGLGPTVLTAVGQAGKFCAKFGGGLPVRKVTPVSAFTNGLWLDQVVVVNVIDLSGFVNLEGKDQRT